jgi:hypothetical protein
MHLLALALQDVGTPPPAAPAPAAPSITIDFSGLGRAIVDALQNAVPDLVGSVGTAVGDDANTVVDQIWSGLWNSQANVITQTSPANTINFGPIGGLTSDAQNAAYGIILLGVVLLGLRTTLSSFWPAAADTYGELLGGIASAAILSSALPLLMLRSIQVLDAVLGHLGGVNFGGALPHSLDNPLLSLIEAVLIVWFAGRFIYRSMKRLVLLAVLAPFGPICMLLRAIPQFRWVSGWWARTWGGLLVGQAPAVLALAIGVQMALFSGVLGVFWTIAFLGAATDLLGLFGGGLLGGSGPGLWTAGLLAARLATGWAGAGAVGVAVGNAGGISDAQLAENYGYQ